MRKSVDISVIPSPISLPSLQLPSAYGDRIILTRWWLDENFGGLPRLLALTTAGTFVIYDISPPCSVLEPLMPSYDPFATNIGTSVHGGSGFLLQRCPVRNLYRLQIIF